MDSIELSIYARGREVIFFHENCVQNTNRKTHKVQMENVHINNRHQQCSLLMANQKLLYAWKSIQNLRFDEFSGPSYINDRIKNAYDIPLFTLTTKWYFFYHRWFDVVCVQVWIGLWLVTASQTQFPWPIFFWPMSMWAILDCDQKVKF